MEKRPPNRLKELRESRGMSLEVLSSRSGVAKNSINLIENQEAHLTLDKMRDLAKALGIPASALLVDEDVEFRPSAANQPVMDALRMVPPELAPEVARGAIAIVSVAKIFAGRGGSGFDGPDEQVGELADLWNSMDEVERSRAVKTLRAAGFGDLGKRSRRST